MSVREWRALPWWEQRVYLEGLTEEFSEDHERAADVHSPGGSTVFDHRPGEFASHGFKERTI